MKTLVLETIDSIYKNKDYDFFRDKCAVRFELLDGLMNLIKSNNAEVNVTEIDLEPSIRFYIKYPNFELGELKVSYKTIIDVSKIIPIFYVQHEFEVENKDERRMSPVLDGFDGQPYTMSQAEMYDAIVDFMRKHDYAEISYAEMNTVIPYITMPADVSIFGPQFTVEICLFHDILNICELEDA
ncbi:hypothetical protein [Listeria booriae]|uniref:hypothetical protein n=1 Tax=Listeria booriae TaxID=1552123 RepID=UPI00162A5AB4|nr:hypothetical protein [Listeria booriae]MBC2322568.1 hypothetical protein [Listeria booriae]MCD2206426.1 hypothetical protein [Listeria booriae]